MSGGSASARAFDVFAGELSLVSASLSSTEWEGVLRRLISEAGSLHVRALVLDDNDLSGQPGIALADAVARLDRLTDLSVCDARLGGEGIELLLPALGSVPGFAKTHAEVWAPMETVASPPAPPQGARLCLMRNNVSDEELISAAATMTSVLRGLHDLSLSGNPLITDKGVNAVGNLAPSLRRLHLGRTGVACTDGGLLHLVETKWPLLEALALNGCPLSKPGFDRLVKSLHQRARNVKTKKIKNDSAEPAHDYFHVDVRGVLTPSPMPLKDLLDKFKLYSKEHAQLPWIRTQVFGGGKHRSDGLVLRHDFEATCHVRMCVKCEQEAADGQITAKSGREGSSSQHYGPHYLELPDVDQKDSVADIVAALVHVANNHVKAGDATGGAHRSKHYTGHSAMSQAHADSNADAEKPSVHEKRARPLFKERSFPFATDPQRLWSDTSLMSAGESLECGWPWPALKSRAIGSLLLSRVRADGGGAAGAEAGGAAAGKGAARRFDKQLGAPHLADAPKVVELTLTLRLAASSPKGNKEGGGASGGSSGAGGAAAAASAGKKRKAAS